MADDCRPPPEKWTLATLEIHLSDRIQSLRVGVEAARVASEKALDKSELIISRRLDQMNEFRGAMVDQQKLMVTRVEWEARYESLIDRVEALFKTINERMDTATHTRELLSLQVKEIEARATAKKENISASGVIVLAGTAILSLLLAFVSFLISVYRH